MEYIISREISVKYSAAKPLRNPLPRDKTLDLDPETHIYAVEESDDTEE